MKSMNWEFKAGRPYTGHLRGFTLIEVMLACLISTVIIGAIYSCYRAGTLAWRRGSEEMMLSQNIRVGLVQIQSEVRSGFTSPDTDNFIFLGRQMRIDFVTVRSIPIESGRKEYDLCRVIYALVDSPWKEGGKSLWRWEKPYPYADKYSELVDNIILNKDIDEEELPPLREGEELVSNLKDIRFRYSDGEDWFNTWNIMDDETSGTGASGSERPAPMTRQLPQAVEVELGIIADKETIRLFKTKIEIPLSSRFKPV